MPSKNARREAGGTLTYRYMNIEIKQIHKKHNTVNMYMVTPTTFSFSFRRHLYQKLTVSLGFIHIMGTYTDYYFK